MNAGTLGGIIGSIVGAVGGILGTYFSIKRTNGPRERAFMVKSAAVGWVAVIAFLALVLALPSPHRHLIAIPYVIALALVSGYGNKRQRTIRREESQNQQVHDRQP